MPKAPKAATLNPTHTADIVIVGAGLSGLAAASHLIETYPTLRTVVLEARDRVGGRAYTVPFAQGVVDLGGQWLAPQSLQPRVCQLATRLGLSLDEQAYPGSDNGNTGMSAAAGQGAPVLSAAESEEMQAIIDELSFMSSVVSVDEPWRCGRAHEWDFMSAQHFFESRCTQAVVLREFRLAVQTILAEEPSQVSLLYLLFFLKANGGFHSVGDGVGGSQSLKVQVGMGGLANAYAASLPSDCIVLSSPVVAIHDWTKKYRGVRIRCADGSIWGASNVIVAMAPLAAAKITFSPNLPDRKLRALQTLPMGAAAKVVAVYNNAFWLNRSSSSDRHFTELGPVFNIFHTNIGGKPGLVGLIVGEQARSWSKLPQEQRRKVVLEQFQKIYDSDQALTPQSYIDNEWQSDPYALGCYGGVAPPGYLTDCGMFLRVATDRVFWAGTETATEWVGYFEGALASGERAAKELLASKTSPIVNNESTTATATATASTPKAKL